MRAGAYDGVEAGAVVGAGSAALQETVLVTKTRSNSAGRSAIRA